MTLKARGRKQAMKEGLLTGFAKKNGQCKLGGIYRGFSTASPVRVFPHIGGLLPGQGRKERSSNFVLYFIKRNPLIAA